MEAVQGSALLIYALVAVIALIVLIAKFKLNPFIVLIVVSLVLGLAVGMPMGNIVKAFETGVLIRVTADIIALSPPLIVEKPQIDRLYQTLREVLQQVA